MYRAPNADRDEQIVRAIDAGVKQYILAERHGLCHQQISAIWRRHKKYIKDDSPLRYWRDLGVSPRAATSLVDEAIYTIEDLRAADLIRLAHARNVGAGKMAEYVELLAHGCVGP